MPLALITDASTSALSAELQQRIQNAWQPLTFFSKKLNHEVKLTAAPPPSTSRSMKQRP
jgi:hypothetical protein